MKHFYFLLFTFFAFNLSFGQVTELYFSKYGEGSSNNKFIEIYNGTDQTIDLSNYAFPSVSNAPTTPGEHEFWNTFTAGATIAAGDVYVIAHPSADATILAAADQTHQYLSNGDDGYALVSGTEASYTVIDWLGDWNADPGSGWAVAGISNATQDNTLTRKSTVCGPNNDWTASAGTTTEDSEWIVGVIDSGWDTLGSYSGCVSGPTLTITSPSNNQEFASGTTTVTLSVSVANFVVDQTPANGGSGDGHIHWTLDGNSQPMKYDTLDETINVADGGSHTVEMFLVDNNHQAISPAVSQTVSFSVAYPCDLQIGTITETCDAITSGTSDTYTATIPFTGGGTTTYTIDTQGVGTIGGDNPSSVTDGTITITGIIEDTDFVVTFTGDSSNSSCDFTRSIDSPNCNPPIILPHNEDFSYANGPLISSPSWSNFSGTEGDLLVVDGKALVQHGTPSEDASMSFTSATGSIYYAFDFSVNDPGQPISGGDYEYFAVFKDDGFNYRARLDIVEANTAGNDYTLGISTTGSTADAIWASDLTFGTTYRVTVKFDQAANIAQLWLDASAETDPSIFGTDQADPGTTITQFGLRQSDSSQNEGILLDNLTIAQSFNETLSNSNYEVNHNLLSLYPNPTKTGFVTIKSNQMGVVQAQVFDLLGKEVINTAVNNERLDVSNLNAGVYVVKLTQNKNTSTKKLIIQ